LKELNKKLNEPINFPDWAPAGLALWMPSIIAEVYVMANMNTMISNPLIALPIASAQIGGIIMADYECGEYIAKKAKAYQIIFHLHI